MPDLQDVVDELAARLRRPISVEDRRWRLLAHSAQGGVADAVRAASILARQAPPEVVAWLDSLGLTSARSPVSVPENPALGMAPRCCAPLRRDEVLLGFLWVIVGDRPLDAAEGAALREAAAEAAQALWQRHSIRQERRSAVERALLSGRGPDLADALGWPETGRYAAVLTETAEAAERRYGAQVVVVAHSLVAGRRSGPVGDRAPLGDGSPSGGAGRPGRGTGLPNGGPLVLALVRGDDDPVIPPRSAAAPFDRLDDVHDAIRRAEAAWLAARASPRLGETVTWHGIGAWGPVTRLWLDAGRPVPPGPVQRLASHGGKLLAAVEAVLDAGGDVAQAATILHVHRATLYRRLERAEEITGLDLEQGDHRLLLHLGIRLHHLNGV